MRQDALSGLGTALGGGIENYVNAFQKGEQTKRQEALQQALQDQDTALKLQQLGINATPQEFRAASSSNEPGALTKLFSNRTQEWQDKQARDADDRKFKREGELLDRDLKRQEMAIKRMQLGNGNSLDLQKKQLELKKLQDDLANGPTPTEGQFKAAGFSKRARQAVEDLEKLPSDIGTGEIADTIQSLGFFPKALKSENRKLYEQARDNFISANLRKESGAAIGDEERLAEERKYFPQPGDTPAVIAQKARAREQAILNLEAEGRPALGRILDAPPVKENSINTSNEAYASDSAALKKQLKSMSREEKIQEAKRRAQMLNSPRGF